ncbi:hypothetical protein PUW79_09915 [Microbacterium sp. NE2HP2]|uniref:hypothetical protein n=1 Tax=Microbacterium plantarum TaxID=1816425 RepID=UPI0023661C69|nr:hypothetical protein [Microbacterium plantarum]MDD7944943.1 hypothetical protein [Microbacterium plantarum]WRK16440.1 hypothetical protein VC184_11015 [Microbacterium plantarum]
MERAQSATVRRARALRGTASAAIATVFAATAHTISGGLAPFWLIVVATLLAAPAAVWLAGRAPSAWRTCLVVLASQGLFHTFFSIAGSTDPTAPLGHVHGGTLAALGPVAHTHAFGMNMTATHVVAAAVTVATLVVGERLVRLIHRGIRRFVRLMSPSVRARTPLLRPAVGSTRVVPARRLRSSLSLRGPPVATA